MQIPLRLGPAELKLIEQLNAAGATAESERLAASGLPTRRVESYHYTDLKQLLRAAPELAGRAEAIGPPALQVAGAYRLLIVNGEVQETTTAPAGVIVGKAKGGVLTERDDILVRLNSALTRESLTLVLEGSVDPVIHIDRRIEGAAGHSNSAAKIFVADGASAVVLETYSGSAAAHLGNHGTHILVGKGATLTHVSIDLSDAGSTHFATHEYEIGADAQLRTLTIHVGANLARQNVFARFAGRGAHGDFTGLNLVGEGQHSDLTLEVCHAVPDCSSKPVVKQVGRGRSTAVFQGKIVVARDAQKTDAKLMMQGLMLSEDAQILSKPELEIYADDVVCGHGSTAGAINEDALFYLMSRGLPKPEAETMLVRAFLNEVIESIDDAALHEALLGVVDGWLGK